jgi:hypothetical protein
MESHAFPVTVFHPVELVFQPRELLVLVAVAALAEGARRRRLKRLKAKGERQKRRERPSRVVRAKLDEMRAWGVMLCIVAR